MESRNSQIAPSIRRLSGPPIRKVIVNQYPLTSLNNDFAELAAMAKNSA